MLLPNPFFISAEKVKRITQNYEIEIREFLKLLIPIAKSYSRSPISDYKVGISAIGKSGNIYLGTNLEFLGVPLNEAIHGEQFLITNARNHGEAEILAMALSAAPCGHCRQFMNEMGSINHLRIMTPNSPDKTLASLLPEGFGPKDLGLTGNLLTSYSKKHSDQATSLIPLALEAAVDSYAPYSMSKSGIAILTNNDKIYCGSYLENVAFNPSLSPLQTALIALIADLRNCEEIKEVVLMEQISAKISHEVMSREIINKIAPNAQFVSIKREF